MPKQIAVGQRVRCAGEPYQKIFTVKFIENNVATIALDGSRLAGRIHIDFLTAV